MSIAAGVAALVDVIIVWGSDAVWTFPSGALLTGVLIAFVLSAQEPWYVVAITAGMAISGKRLLRTRLANIFNPAALALVISALAFSTGQSWWGALPDLGLFGVAVVLVVG